MAIKDWPQQERPREKLLASGPAVLSDAELLAIFLRSGTRGCTAVDLARDLLSRFGGLRQLLDADRDTLCTAVGLGDASYAQLQAVLEIGRRHLLQSLQRNSVLSSPENTRHFLTSHLRACQQEVFLCLFLDSRHAVIVCEELFYGTIDGASVYPREVVKRALKHNAAALILAHNHPSGVAEPSQADVRITERLKAALALVDIRVLDHMVVGDGEVVSLAERGLL
jgi:DNA repair protein RadC